MPTTPHSIRSRTSTASSRAATRSVRDGTAHPTRLTRPRSMSCSIPKPRGKQRGWSVPTTSIPLSI
jgi:hypothetical protein